MKALGLSLLVLGTIVGTLGGAHLPEADWTIAGVGLALLVLGVLLVKLGARRAEGSSGAGTAKDDPLVALRSANVRLGELAASAGDMELSELLEQLTKLEGELLEPIAEGSPRLLAKLGPVRFAEIFGAYASAERFVARAWSAAADRERAEAQASLEPAARRAREAVGALDAATGK